MPKLRRLYLDTSAYLCILLGEEGSERLSEQTAGADLLSSVLLVLETKRNLVRLAREGLLTTDQVQGLPGPSRTGPTSSWRYAISLWTSVSRMSSRPSRHLDHWIWRTSGRHFGSTRPSRSSDS